MDGDAKINMQEFGEAIKTQLASSSPVRLRNQELGMKPKQSATAIKRRASRSISRKRSGSVSYRGSQQTPQAASRAGSFYG